MAVVWSETDSREAEAAQRVVACIKDRLPGMQPVAAGGGFVVLSDGMRPHTFEAYRLTPDRGVVLGRLFDRDLEQDAVAKRVVLTEATADAIVATTGQHLLDRYWGRYVAFIHDKLSGTTYLIRDPSGGIACFVSAYQGARIVFSRMEDCISLGLVSFSINWQYAHACLTGREVQSPATGINEVLQVRQGERIALRAQRRIDRTLCWNPMRISALDPIEEPKAAIIAARSTTQACIAAWASCYPGILLRYSAGFDSTIVLSCLRRAASLPTIACLHYFDPPADDAEREYLRRAIDGTACGSEHVEVLEVARSPQSIRLDSLLKVQRCACLPFYKSWLLSEPRDSALARERGATLFDGVYGNQLFLTETFYAAIDYVWRHASGEGVFHIAPDSGPPERTLWIAVAHALQQGLFRFERPKHLEPSDYPFVNRAVLAAIECGSEEYLHRYWRQHRSRVPPGKLSHIAMMCMPSEMNVPFSHNDDPERVTPLLSQPLMELFLRIPTYVLNTGGLDRGVARQAFSEYLPRELLSRSMVEIGRRVPHGEDQRTVLRHNEAFMREILLEGVLATERVLDRDAIARYLSEFLEGRVLADINLLETYFDLEIWLQSWKSLVRKGTACEVLSPGTS